MVAVVSGKGGTSSRLCSAPNFSTSENLGRERESSEIGLGDEKVTKKGNDEWDMKGM